MPASSRKENNQQALNSSENTRGSIPPKNISDAKALVTQQENATLKIEKRRENWNNFRRSRQNALQHYQHQPGLEERQLGEPKQGDRESPLLNQTQGPQVKTEKYRSVEQFEETVRFLNVVGLVSEGKSTGGIYAEENLKGYIFAGTDSAYYLVPTAPEEGVASMARKEVILTMGTHDARKHQQSQDDTLDHVRRIPLQYLRRVLLPYR
jgi:hypothetical protein